MLLSHKYNQHLCVSYILLISQLDNKALARDRRSGKFCATLADAGNSSKAQTIKINLNRILGVACAATQCYHDI